MYFPEKDGPQEEICCVSVFCVRIFFQISGIILLNLNLSEILSINFTLTKSPDTIFFLAEPLLPVHQVWVLVGVCVYRQ